MVQLEQFTLVLNSLDDLDSMKRVASNVASLLAYVEQGGSAVFVDARLVNQVHQPFIAAVNCVAQRLRTQRVGIAGFIAAESLTGKQELIEAGLYPTLTYVGRSLHLFGSKSPELKAGFLRAEPEVISNFVRNFSPYFVGVPNLIESLESTLAELMDNVYAHSGSLDGGWIAAKYYDSERVLRFSICDLGVSIPCHLRSADPTYADQPDPVVLDAAFVEGVSGDRRNRFGSGLPYVRDATLRVGGSLQVYAGKAVYRATPKSAGTFPVDVRFPGTLISAEWPAR